MADQQRSMLGLPEKWNPLERDNDGWDKVNVLTKGERSLFFDADADELLDLLVDCGAEIVNVPGDDGDSDRVGCVLFRHLQEMKNVYVTVDGPIHFFSPTTRGGNVPDEFKGKKRPPLLKYQPITLSTLKVFYKYMGSIWPGQVAGLIEIMQQISLKKPRVQDTDVDAGRRRDALRKSHLADLVNVWLSCCYCPNGTYVLRVPVKGFVEKFLDERANTVMLFNREELDATILKRRCYEELAFRQAEYLSYTALLAKERSAAVLAMMLHSHYQRTQQRSWDKDNNEFVWMMNQGDAGNSSAIRKELNKIAGLDVVKRRNQLWEFDSPEDLRRVYQTVFQEEAKRNS